MLSFQAGDESAFAELVERNQAKVHGVVYRFLGNRADVEDLVQEVFLRVFRTMRRYTPTAKFTTWLYRIAANLSLNAIRARGKVRIAHLGIPHEDDADGFRGEVEDLVTAPPHADIAAREMAEVILAAVDKLPENQRMAMILNRYEQLSYEQVAEVMDCSTMAIKSLLSRARVNLRRALSQHLQA